MSGLPASYASPLLRWALLLEDHPGADYEFDCVSWDDLPPKRRPPRRLLAKQDEEFCTATIIFPAESGKVPVMAWSAMSTGVKTKQGNKPVADVEQWNTLTTKTLGRALKKAGYPDDTEELKLSLLWRRRMAEISAIAGGSAPAQLEPGVSVERALEATARATPDAVGADDDYDAPPPDVDPDTGEIRSGRPAEPASTETRKKLSEAVNALSRIDGAADRFKAWAKDEGLHWTRPDSEAQAQLLLARATELAEAPFESGDEEEEEEEEEEQEGAYH